MTTHTTLRDDNSDQQDPPPSWTRGKLELIGDDTATPYGHKLMLWGRRGDDRAAVHLVATKGGPRVMLVKIFHASGVPHATEWLPGKETADLDDAARTAIENWARAELARWHAEADS